MSAPATASSEAASSTNAPVTTAGPGLPQDAPGAATSEETEALVRSVFIVGGLDCADCAAKLEKRIRRLQGVASVDLNFAASKLTAIHNCPSEAIVAAVERSGYSAAPAQRPGAKAPGGGMGAGTAAGTGGGAERSFLWRNQKAVLTASSGLFIVAAYLASYTGAGLPVVHGFFLAGMVLGGYHVAKAGFFALLGRTLDMNFLMTVAAVGATAIGQWNEGAAAVFLFSLGNTLQAYAFDRTRRSIRSLIELTPKEAVVRRWGNDIRLPVEEITIDDTVVVKPGERIPVDGMVTAGQSAVNQAPITGESTPVEKQEGAEVFAGTINGRGALEVRVTRKAQDTTISRILSLVEEAQARRAPSQQFVDVFARYYTPAVIVVATLVAVAPALFFGQPFIPWFKKALILLVISCPCALVISTPVAIVSAIGSASRLGVLIKGGAHLEAAGSLKAVAFDKTGTLTEGRPAVTDLVPEAGVTEKELLMAAAAAESRSEHPLAAAVLTRARHADLPITAAEATETVPGLGVRAVVDGVAITVGAEELAAPVSAAPVSAAAASLALRSRATELEAEGKTVAYVTRAGRFLGLCAVADRLRPGAPEAVAALESAGIARVVMLTGDNPATAAAVARRAGVGDFRASLLPEQKVDAVRGLLGTFGKVAMVGDGVNDAPALATATVGVAMGAAGSAAALETADVALMSDDLSKLAYLIRLGRRTLGIIRQNIAFSLTVKAVFLVLTFLNLATLWMAVFADTGAALIVIANGLRLVRAR